MTTQRAYAGTAGAMSLFPGTEVKSFLSSTSNRGLSFGTILRVAMMFVGGDEYQGGASDVLEILEGDDAENPRLISRGTALPGSA